MAATSFTLTFDNTTDTTYRVWVAALITQLDAMTGWTRSSDTGQINTSTATRSNNSATNYAVWQTNDGGTTIYVRFDFVNTNVGTVPGLGITVGYSTNGAGVITGTQATSRWGNNTNNVQTDTSPRTCLISSAAGRMALALNINAANTPNTMILSVERSRDASGATTNDGALVLLATGTNSGSGPNQTNWQYLPASGGTPTLESRLPAIMTNGASTAFGATVGLAPVIPLAGAAQNPGLNWLVHHSSDFTRDTQHAVAVYGTNRNYYILGPNLTQNVGGNGVTFPNGRVAMLYE